MILAFSIFFNFTFSILTRLQVLLSCTRSSSSFPRTFVAGVHTTAFCFCIFTSLDRNPSFHHSLPSLTPCKNSRGTLSYHCSGLASVVNDYSRALSSQSSMSTGLFILHILTFAFGRLGSTTISRS